MSPAGDIAWLPSMYRGFLEGFLRREGNATESLWSHFGLKACNSGFALFSCVTSCLRIVANGPAFSLQNFENELLYLFAGAAVTKCRRLGA